MPDQLESALVITLKDTLNWESALEIASTGSLPAVNPAAPFNPLDYQTRDRQLAYRDVVIGAAVGDIASAIADVWHYTAPAPMLEGFAPAQLTHNPSEITSTSGTLTQLRHVLYAGIPWDAARFADADLYGRDALVYEVLARAAQKALTKPPVVPLDSTGTLIPTSGSLAWSLAEGVAQRLDVNANLPLRRDLFKQPDQNLADRDNQMAGYVAQTAQVLKNPFAFADRIYVRVDNVDVREPETYVLISDDGTNRVWQAEPALFERFQFHYNVPTGLLQWFNEHTDQVHVPQLAAVSINGIVSGQLLTSLPQIPELKDAQYWRQKAGQVIPDGEQLVDTPALLNWTSGASANNVLLTPDSAIMTVEGQRADFTIPATLVPARYRINVLVKPDSHIDILGAENISSTNGTLGGADYDINVSSGSLVGKRYLVQGGAGVVYAGTLYTDEAVFSGISGSNVYTQSVPANPSTVRQYGVSFQLALPPGPWKLALQYTNLLYETTGFGVQVVYQQSGANATNVIQDVTPLPFSGPNGTLFTTNQTQFDVLDANPFTLPVYWTYGTGQFHLRKLIFDSDVISTGSYDMTAIFAGSSASANVTGINHLPDTMQFVVTSTGTTAGDVSLLYNEANSCPLKIKQIDIQTLGTYNATPSSDGFMGWRQECLDRAETVIQQGYAQIVRVLGTNIPTFRSTGSIWDSYANESWMGMIEITNPRLRELDGVTTITIGRQYVVVSGAVIYDGSTYQVGQRFYGTASGGSTVVGGAVNQVGALTKSRPGHVGKPALIPYGLFVQSTGTVMSFYNTPLSVPVFVACQPWMIDIGVYVVQPEFWMPEFYSGIPRSSLLSA